MWRLIRAACVLVTLVVSASAVAQVAPYRFELLAERPDGPAPFGDNGVRMLPALNDNGTVAYILPRAGATATDEVLYTGTPGNVRVVETPRHVAFGGVSINNPGRIAFAGYAQASPGLGVFAASPGGPLLTIRDPASFSNRYETAISDAGTVIVTEDPAIGMPEWVAGSIAVGDGSAPAQTVFTGSSPQPGATLRTSQISRPRTSGSGEWVASEQGTLSFGSYTAMHTNRGSTYFDPAFGFGRGTADVANGALLFQGTTFGDRARKLYLSRDGGEPVAVPGSEVLPAGYVALNDDGVIALLSGGPSELEGTLLQLFMDGAARTVLAAGDPLLGSSVSMIGFDPKGFNDGEQFALLVGLANGRDVYVLASPVPEPGVVGAACAAAGVVVMRRGRRQRA